MSEHHRVAWGSSPGPDRGDGGAAAAAAAAAAWWPAGLNEQQQQQQQQQAAAAAAAHNAAQQQAAHNAHQQQQAHQQAAAMHQHLLQQQQQQQQQVLNQQQQQHHQDIVRSTAAAAATTQQLFTYKMASSFQNPATTGAQSSPVSSSSPVAAAAARGYDYRTGVPNAPPGVQWWPYAGNVMDQQNNLHQQQLQQGQHLNITTQTSTPPILSPHQIQQLHHQNNFQQNNAVLQQDKRGAKNTKPRGRMTAYAFFVQTCRQEHKKKHPDENIVFQEFSKKCALRWKTMSDKEKKRFHEMAEKDKKRYDTEMQSYIPPKGEKVGRGKKRKHIKDPNAPKRSLSAFFWFCNDERGKVKMINPEYGVGDIAKELGKRWSDASPELKSKYEAMAEKDKARYEREMTAYKKKLKDGPGVGAPAVAKKAESEEEWEEEDE